MSKKSFQSLFSRSVKFQRCYSNAIENKEIDQSKPWIAVIGLEVHAQIASASKLFSGSSTRFGGAINDQVAFLDAALPGTLPVLNRRCVEAGVLTALALNSNINLISYFDRKHYFYADLPAGYQITQQRQPLAKGGYLSYIVNGQTQRAGIWQIQLEQDSGKSLHIPEQSTSFIDLNRAGVGLMEIVTAPDFSSSQDAAAFVKELQLILMILGTCDGKMSEGSLRVDASVSLHKPGEPLGIRSEVKNLNSVRFINKAIDYEISRQLKILENGGEVENETRSFDPDAGVTMPMRDKEKVHDYRFMPEPNLLPLRLIDNTITAQDTDPQGLVNTDPQGLVNIDHLRLSMPLLPSERRQLLVDKYRLSVDHAFNIVNEVGLYETLLAICEKGRPPQLVTNIMLRELLEVLNSHDITLPDSYLDDEQFGDIIDMLVEGTISRSTALKLLTECIREQGVNVREIVEMRDWSQITDPLIIGKISAAIIEQNPKLVKKAMKDKDRQVQALIQLVINQSQERAEPRIVKDVIRHKLGLSNDSKNS